MRSERLCDLDHGLQNEFLPGPLGLLHHSPNKSTLSHLTSLDEDEAQDEDFGILWSITEGLINWHTVAKSHLLK